MRKLTLPLTLVGGLLAAGLAHACPPRISAHELFSEAHEAQTAKCAAPALAHEAGLFRAERECDQAAREAELAARAAREYSSARAVSQPPPSLLGLVIELKKTTLKK